VPDRPVLIRLGGHKTREKPVNGRITRNLLGGTKLVSYHIRICSPTAEGKVNERQQVSSWRFGSRTFSPKGPSRPNQTASRRRIPSPPSHQIAGTTRGAKLHYPHSLLEIRTAFGIGWYTVGRASYWHEVLIPTPNCFDPRRNLGTETR